MIDLSNDCRYDGGFPGVTHTAAYRESLCRNLFYKFVLAQLPAVPVRFHTEIKILRWKIKILLLKMMILGRPGAPQVRDGPLPGQFSFNGRIPISYIQES